jgi:hypothetical protein
MATGYSQTPTLLKGAIIQFKAPMLVPIPNIILFQYNPETLGRTFTPWAPMERSLDEKGALKPLTKEQDLALSQPYDPQETISVSLELDATDDMEDPGILPIASLVGVADRLAALEMLLYPPGQSLLGNLLGSVKASLSGGISVGASVTKDLIDRKTVPVVLFFWGPGRIVPVRITTFSVEEQAFLPTLYPLRAKVSLGMRVLDENDLLNIEHEETENTAVIKLAKACYTFTKVQKEVLATANLAHTVDAILGVLPI